MKLCNISCENVDGSIRIVWHLQNLKQGVLQWKTQVGIRRLNLIGIFVNFVPKINYADDAGVVGGGTSNYNHINGI